MLRKHGIAINRRTGGFTLPEVMLASTILLFVVSALTQAVVSGQMHVYEAIREVRATTLAEAMLDEVLAKPYLDPEGGGAVGPEAGEDDRGDFDNVDDFDGFVEAAGDVADFSGAVYPQSYANYSRQVAVAATTQTFLGQDIDGMLITVTVTDERGRTWALDRFVPEESE